MFVCFGFGIALKITSTLVTMHFTYLLISTLGAILTIASANPVPKLNWDVYLAPGPAINGTNLTWSQTAFTLIHGSSSAILVDAPISASSANALADWIERTAPGIPLTYS
jgi:disulfide bond formation protein DsbB